MDIELTNLLRKTGFSQKEAQVYLALLELGQSDVTDIAKKAELKRSIVYVLVENLMEKGYITQLPNRQINTYQAIDPGVILSQIKLTTKNLAEMLPYMRSLQSKSEKKPKIHFIDNPEGITKIYDQMNEVDNQFFISSYSRIEEIFPGIIKKWIDNFKKGRYNFTARHLIPDMPKDLEYAKEFLKINQKVRASNMFKKMKMDFTVYGNKLGITSLEEEPFIVVIESKSLVDSLMPIFEIAWASGKEIK